MPSLAEKATFSVNFGGNKVEGASIRLIEEIAKIMGNMSTSIKIERDEKNKNSLVTASASDLQKNIHKVLTSNVPHGSMSPLMLAKMEGAEGHKKLRKCLEAIIPVSLVESAVDKCRETLDKKYAKVSTKTLQTAAQNMVREFSAIGVTPEMIERKLGHSLNSLTVSELKEFLNYYNACLDDNLVIKVIFADSYSPAPTTERKDLNTLLNLGKNRGDTGA